MKQLELFNNKMILLPRQLCLKFGLYRTVSCFHRTYKVFRVKSDTNKTSFCGLRLVALGCKNLTDAEGFKTSAESSSELKNEISHGYTSQETSKGKVLSTHNYRRQNFVEVVKGSAWISSHRKQKSIIKGDTEKDFEQKLKAMTKEEVVQQFGRGIGTKLIFDKVIAEINTWDMSSSYMYILDVLTLFMLKGRYRDLAGDSSLTDILKTFIVWLEQNFESCPKDQSFVTSVSMVLTMWKYSGRNLSSLRRLLTKCENFTAANVSMFSFEELAIVVNTLTFLQKSHSMGPKHSVIFWNAFKEHLNKRLLLQSSEQLSTVFLSVVFEFASKLNVKDMDMFLVLGNFLVTTNSIDNIDISFLNKVLLFFSKQKVCHGDLMSAIKKQFIYLSKKRENSRLKDISQIAWHFSRISNEEDSLEFYNHLSSWVVEVLDKQPISLQQEFVNASILDVMTACLIKDVFPDNLLKRFFRRDLVRQAVDADSNNRQRTIHPLIIQTCLDIEYPDYDGEQLNKADMEYVQAVLFRSIPPQEYQRTFAHIESIQDVFHHIRNSYGDNFFHMHKILPFCIHPGIEMRIDKQSNELVEFTPQSYDDILKEKGSHCNSLRRIMVLMPPETKLIHKFGVTDKTAYIAKRKKQMPGMDIMTMRLIRKLGYNVYSNPWRLQDNPKNVINKLLKEDSYFRQINRNK